MMLPIREMKECIGTLRCGWKDKEKLKRLREGGCKLQPEELRSRNTAGAFQMWTGG